MKMSDTVVTPGQVERRLRQLSDELDEAHKDLVSAENNYATVKSNYEIAMAKSRIYLSSRSSASGKNYTVQEREDLSLVENEGLHRDMGIADAVVRASRANSTRVKTQIDLARSLGTSVRAGFDL
jgi:hypothetical protein